MSRPASLLPLVTASLLSMGLCGNNGCDPKPGNPSAGYSKTTAIADGVDTIVITVQAITASRNPLSHSQIELVVSGTGNVVSGPENGLTDQDGKATFWLASTVAETKQLTVKLFAEGHTYPFDLGTPLQFVAPTAPPPKLEIRGFPSVVPGGDAIAEFTVAVVDGSGQVVPVETPITVSLEREWTGFVASEHTSWDEERTAVSVAGIATFTGLMPCSSLGAHTLFAKSPGGLIASAPFELVPGTAAYFLMKDNAANATRHPVSGTPWKIDVTAKDKCGNLATGYTGEVLLSSSSSSPTPPKVTMPDKHVATAAEQGQFTLEALFKYESNSTNTFVNVYLEAKDAATGVEGVHGVAIQPERTKVVRLKNVPSTAEPLVPFQFQVEVVDPVSGAPLDLLSEVTVTLSDPTATLIGPGSNGTYTATFPRIGTWQITAKRLDNEARAWLNVVTEFNFAIAGPLVPVSAGVPFTIRATLRNSLNEVWVTYDEVVHFTSSDPKATLPADYAFRWDDNGTRAFTVTLRTAGPQTITLTEAGKTKPSGTFSVVVLPGPAVELVLASIGGPISAGTPADVSVRLQDAFGNKATGYRGTIAFSATDPRATFDPPSYSFGELDQGDHDFTGAVTFKSPGNWKLLAFDTATLPLIDAIDPVVVQLGPPARLSFFKSPAAAIVGKPMEPVQVQVFDAGDNLLSPALDVTLALSTNAAGATLGGTTTRSIVLGAATFEGLTVDRQGTGFVLEASSPGLPSIPSPLFDASCDAGHTGPACLDCAPGFSQTAQGACAPACAPNPCTHPPADECLSPALLAVYANEGICDPSTNPAGCEYWYETVDCTDQAMVCLEGTCAADPCLTANCPADPPSCADGGATLVTHQAVCTRTGIGAHQCSQTTSSTSCALTGKVCSAAEGACVADEWFFQAGVAGKYTYATAVASDPSGDVYVAGYTQGSLHGETAAGSTSAFVSRFSPTGTRQWTKLLGASSDTTQAAGIAVTADAVYVAGHTWVSLPGQTRMGDVDLFVAKYSLAGALQWVHQFGGSHLGYPQLTSAWGVAADGAGAVYVVGSTGADLDGVPRTAVKDAFIIKYAEDGTRQWTRTLGGTTGESTLYSAAVVPGGVVVAGMTTGSADGTTSTNGKEYMVLAKYDPSGNRSWIAQRGKTTANTRARSVAVDPGTGNVFVTGITYAGLDGQTLKGAADVFLMKFNSSGVWQRTRQYGAATQETSGLGIAVEGSEVYATGYTTGNLNSKTLTGSVDLFVLHVDDMLLPVATRLIGVSGKATSGDGIVARDDRLFLAGGTDGALPGKTASGLTDMALIAIPAPQY